MQRVSLELDARRRAVTLNGRETVLQEKSWRVLSMLRAGAPQVVSRREIIDTVWQGNAQTGEKGLNQAIWAIRAALVEDPREPRFIRTVPRTGYQWLHANVRDDSVQEAPTRRDPVRALTGIAAVVVSAVAVAYFSSSISVGGADSMQIAVADTSKRVATKAYLVDRDIHVELADGCLGILKNANDAEIGAPVLSSDGTEVAVTVHESGSCRLVTISLADGERRDFENCPAI